MSLSSFLSYIKRLLPFAKRLRIWQKKKRNRRCGMMIFRFLWWQIGVFYVLVYRRNMLSVDRIKNGLANTKKRERQYLSLFCINYTICQISSSSLPILKNDIVLLNLSAKLDNSLDEFAMFSEL